VFSFSHYSYGRMIRGSKDMINTVVVAKFLELSCCKSRSIVSANLVWNAHSRKKIVLNTVTILVAVVVDSWTTSGKHLLIIGIGAVIYHKYPNGSERLIAYASKTLSDSERNYSKIDHGAFSIVFGIAKFYQHLNGHKFSLLTDQKPLLATFNPKKGILTMAANRLQRWVILLSGYTWVQTSKGTWQCRHAVKGPWSILRWPTKLEHCCKPYTGQPSSARLTCFNYWSPESSKVWPNPSEIYTFIKNGWPQTN